MNDIKNKFFSEYTHGLLPNLPQFAKFDGWIINPQSNNYQKAVAKITTKVNNDSYLPDYVLSSFWSHSVNNDTGGKGYSIKQSADPNVLTIKHSDHMSSGTLDIDLRDFDTEEYLESKINDEHHEASNALKVVLGPSLSEDWATLIDEDTSNRKVTLDIRTPDLRMDSAKYGTYIGNYLVTMHINPKYIKNNDFDANRVHVIIKHPLLSKDHRNTLKNLGFALGNLNEKISDELSQLSQGGIKKINSLESHNKSAGSNVNKPIKLNTALNSDALLHKEYGLGSYVLYRKLAYKNGTSNTYALKMVDPSKMVSAVSDMVQAESIDDINTSNTDVKSDMKLMDHKIESKIIDDCISKMDQVGPKLTDNDHKTQFNQYVDILSRLDTLDQHNSSNKSSANDKFIEYAEGLVHAAKDASGSSKLGVTFIEPNNKDKSLEMTLKEIDSGTGEDYGDDNDSDIDSGVESDDYYDNDSDSDIDNDIESDDYCDYNDGSDNSDSDSGQDNEFDSCEFEKDWRDDSMKKTTRLVENALPNRDRVMHVRQHHNIVTMQVSTPTLRHKHLHNYELKINVNHPHHVYIDDYNIKKTKYGDRTVKVRGLHNLAGEISKFNSTFYHE